MRLARLGPRGREVPAVVTDGAVRDLRGLTPDLDPAFLAAGGVDRVRAALAAGALPELPGAAGLRTGAPLARPGAVVCIGMNYAAHAAESGAAPPAQPVVFLKTPSCLGGPDDAVPIPPGSQRTDWEVELGVVIGRRASYLGPDTDPLTHVAGYVLADDLSERTYQLDHSGGQWSKGKCAPGFGPLGPWLTPEGVALSGRFPYLRPGDVVEVEIDGLGRQRHEMVAT